MNLSKFEHTIFALPFALSGMLLANPNKFPDFMTFAWVILAMVGGRTAAMAFNRVIDADIDKKILEQPQGQHASGRIKKISKRSVMVYISLGLMTFAVWQFASLFLQAVIARRYCNFACLFIHKKIYKFVASCFVGCALGAGAAGGWLAVSGEITLPRCIMGLRDCLLGKRI
ncbi:MAG: UbiA family prenyltransferase [Bacillus subtilis]|nr:UbiA family prenyltransferase [Bacillus subtilis]